MYEYSILPLHDGIFIYLFCSHYPFTVASTSLKPLENAQSYC